MQTRKQASMASPSLTVLLRMLEPWLVRARMRVGASIDTRFTQATTLCVWLRWNMPTAGEFIVEDVETMEMLELLARVDFRAAWKLMLEITKETMYLDQIVDAAPKIGDPDTVYARFEIAGLHHTLVNATVKHALRFLVLEIHPEDHSPMYHAVRQTLLQCWADTHQLPSPFVRGLDQRIQLKLSINPQGLQDRDAERLLHEVATATMVTGNPDRLELYPSWQESASPRVSTLSGTFEVHAMTIAFDATNITDAQLLSAQSVWEDTDAAVNWIGFEPAADRLSPAVTAKFLCSLLVTNAKVMAPSKLDLYAEGSMDEFGAACAALAKSQGIRYVCFDRGNRLFWAWIAYAISSRDAAHQISHVRIDAMTLTEACVELFERVLHVVANCVDKPHVCVLYPEVGLCWVHRNQIIRRLEIDPEPESSSRRAILRLDLDVYRDTDIQALTRLIPSFGTTKLQKLEISGVRGLFLDDAFFGRLFEACPRLRHLDLVSIVVTNLDWLQVHGADLSSLALIDVETLDPDNYMRFLDSIAGSLVKLHIQLPVHELQDLIVYIERMLSMNQLMGRMLLSFFTDQTDVELMKTLSQRIAKQSGMPLVTRSAPLPLKTKLAFLSVSSTCQSSPSSSNVGGGPSTKIELKGPRVLLDAEVISMVFRFAAPRKRRFCGFVNPVATYD